MQFYAVLQDMERKEMIDNYARTLNAQRVAKRKKMEKQLENTLTVGEYGEIRRYYNNRCAYCGKEGRLHQEHLVPVYRGGGRTFSNIVVACAHCNASKGTKTFEEWYPESTVYSAEREYHILNRPMQPSNPPFHEIRIR
jgi:hypothetical protein